MGCHANAKRGQNCGGSIAMCVMGTQRYHGWRFEVELGDRKCMWWWYGDIMGSGMRYMYIYIYIYYNIYPLYHCVIQPLRIMIPKLRIQLENQGTHRFTVYMNMDWYSGWMMQDNVNPGFINHWAVELVCYYFCSRLQLFGCNLYNHILIILH